MPIAEQETGTLHHPPRLDAPPGNALLLHTEIPQDLTIIASPPEAILLSTTSVTQPNINPFVDQLPYDVKTPFTPTLKTKKDLRIILRGQIENVPMPNPSVKENSSTILRSNADPASIPYIDGELTTTRVSIHETDVFVYSGKTIQGREWIISTPGEQFKVSRRKGNRRLNGAGEELKERQWDVLSSDERDIRHDSFVNFFTTNWDQLVTIFSDSPHPNNSEPLQRFMEVQMNDLVVKVTHRDGSAQTIPLGIVDFIGELPDGQLAIVEFRCPGTQKLKQIARHTRGVKEVAKKHNGKKRIPNITQFVATFIERENTSLVKILPKSADLVKFM